MFIRISRAVYIDDSQVASTLWNSGRLIDLARAVKPSLQRAING
jgi:hypothetical protein